MINVETIETFIKGSANYFALTTGIPAEIGTPFLKELFEPEADYHGQIGLSGSYRGSIIVSVKTSMVQKLLHFFGEDTSANELLSDLVGEMANTIAGNAREYFGSEFMISVPKVTIGSSIPIPTEYNNTSFMIPINWQNEVAYHCITFEKL
jgi:chemotaxis protein CheX